MTQEIKLIQVKCARCKDQWWCCCSNMKTTIGKTVINNICLCCWEHCKVVKEFDRRVKPSIRNKVNKEFKKIHAYYGLNTQINGDINDNKKNK